MSTELAMQERSAQLIAAPRYSEDQMQLLVDTIAKGCDPNEFKLFIEIAKMSRLNPFTGQIRPVKRWNSALEREAMVIQTGIDGYRAIASRTGQVAGIDDAKFDTEEEEHPNWAKVTVYRRNEGEKVPFTATARWKEYVQIKKGKNGQPDRPNAMWSRMPYLMLAKCAEALALRKAFPDDLAGIYTDEEMGQADNPSEGSSSKPIVTMPKRASEKQPEQKDAAEKVDGTIETIREGKNGAEWLMLKDGRILFLEEKFTDDAIKEDVTISVNAVKVQRATGGAYHGVLEVLAIGIGGGGGAPVNGGGSAPPAAATEEKQAEFVQELDSAMSEPSADSAINLDELVGDNKVQKASDLPAGSGKIGPGRAQSLYILCGRNKSANNGLNEANIKKVLARMTPPLEHLSDLPKDMLENFQKMATGELDWRPLLED